MFSDGPKRQGRFLKKGSKVSERVALQEFSFREINTMPVLSHDNQNRTLFHTKYHQAEEIKSAVHPPDKFDDDLMPENQRRPVLIPLDFTREWERDRKMRKDRVRMRDDEDGDFDYESAVREERLRQTAEEDEAAQRAAYYQRHPEARPKGFGEEDGEEAPADGGFRFQKPQGAKTPAEVDSPQQVDSAASMFMNALSGEAPAAAPASAAAPAPAAAPVPAQFIPASPAIDYEAQAQAEYQKTLERREQAEADIAKLAEDAKAAGYRDGYRFGEEKGELLARQAAAELFGKVGELIQEVGKLQHVVLENVQQSFYEICQGMAEALFRREFSINPDSFVTVLRRAISEAVEPGKFKIRVHPDMHDRIVALGVKDLEPSLVKDPEMDPADFRVESEMSVVDVNLRKLIQDLLNQADLSLIAPSEKAG